MVGPFPHSRILGPQPETTAVAEQEQAVFGNTNDLLIHHWNKVNQGHPGLSELPEDFLLEQQHKRVFNPGEGMVSDWINRYTQSNFPFVIGIASQRIIPANPLRTYLIIQNKSAGLMFVNTGQGADAFNGIRIIAGGNYELIGGATGGAHCPGDDIFVAGDAAGLSGVLAEGVIMAVSPEGI